MIFSGNAEMFATISFCRFAIELIESNQDRLKAAIILKEKLDYNEQMIYHVLLTASVSIDIFMVLYNIVSQHNDKIESIKRGKITFECKYHVTWENNIKFKVVHWTTSNSPSIRWIEQKKNWKFPFI